MHQVTIAVSYVNKILSERQDFGTMHPAKVELGVRACKLTSFANNL